MNTYIAYCRVSTTRQGQSGLGLEAQQAAVQAFVASRGVIAQEFIEVESGKKDTRPQLAAALAAAKATGATLLIAKLDRLSRNVGFIFALRDSGVDFVACDLPDANTLTIGIFATVAQHERELISQRTTAALGALRARGVKLGSPAQAFPAGASAKGVAARRQKAADCTPTKQARQLALLLREKGQTTRQIAAALNDTGYTTRQGGVFHPTTVLRLLAA